MDLFCLTFKLLEVLMDFEIHFDDQVFQYDSSLNTIVSEKKDVTL